VEGGSAVPPDIENKSSKDPYDLYLTKVKETHVRDAIESPHPPIVR
jgi:hypothetical protein